MCTAQITDLANLPDPALIAWLLRPDHRPEQAATDRVTALFRTWWAIEGVGEYPAWRDRRPLPDAMWWEPVAGTSYRGTFGLSRMLAYFLDKRPGLREWLDLSSEEGVLRANAWLFTRGLVEHDLLARVTPALQDVLNAPVPFLEVSSQEPGPSWLMFFLWMCDPLLQDTYDLREAEPRLRYRRWFLQEGAAAHSLSPLLDKADAGPDQTPRAIRARRGAKAAKRPPGFNLIGYVRGEFGIGEDVRMAVAACEAAGIPHALVNLDPGGSASQGDTSLESRLETSTSAALAPYASNVFCLTGFETARAYLEFGPQLFEHRHNIGWWPWELPVWPRHWDVAFGLMDEIWAASRYTQDMYIAAQSACLPAAVRRPVTLMPMAVTIDRLQPVSRAALGLPANHFLYLYIFDFNSYLARKNPFAAISAFQRAFPHDETVGLVFKTMNSQPADRRWRRFLGECRADPRIHLIDRTLARGEVLGLVAACDAYVSLHRAEGFGRTLAEAMLLGKPVIGTDFSGNRDFLDDTTGYPVRWRRRTVRNGEYPFITPEDRAWWAEPDRSDAARQMRAAREAALAGHLPDMGAITRRFSPREVGIWLRKHLPR